MTGLALTRDAFQHSIDTFEVRGLIRNTHTRLQDGSLFLDIDTGLNAAAFDGITTYIVGDLVLVVGSLRFDAATSAWVPALEHDGVYEVVDLSTPTDPADEVTYDGSYNQFDSGFVLDTWLNADVTGTGTAGAHWDINFADSARRSVTADGIAPGDYRITITATVTKESGTGLVSLASDIDGDLLGTSATATDPASAIVGTTPVVLTHTRIVTLADGETISPTIRFGANPETFYAISDFVFTVEPVGLDPELTRAASMSALTLIEVTEGTHFGNTFWKNLTLVSSYVEDESEVLLEQHVELVA